jgi:hypothetical protein
MIMSNRDVNNEMSFEPKDGYDERVAISNEDKAESQNLVICDVITGPPSGFDITTVSEGAELKAEDVPEKFTSGTNVFKIVPKEDGEFVATSLNYFENHIGGNRHIFGLQPAPKIREQYTAWVTADSDKSE